MSYTKSPYKVTVTTAATPLVDPTTPGGVTIAARVIRNLSGVTVYLGGSDVTADTTKGWALAAGADHPDSITNGVIYAIVAAGTADVQVWEVIN